MARYHIVCSTLEGSGHRDGHEHVATVGYMENGRKIVKSRTEMVRLLDNGNSAYTTGGGEVAEVKVMNCHCGVRVLRTHEDTTKKDNLHYLPKC